MELSAALAAGLRDRLFSGASAVSSTPGAPVQRAVAGTLAHDDPTPVTAATRFDLASLTKVFTATVVHSLAEVGALDLDRPTERGFTIGQLLAHTSGLPAVSDVWRRTDLRPAQRLQRALDAPLESAPGAEFRYSCVGYVTAGHLAEEATGQGLDSLLEEFVTHPLGLGGPLFWPVAEPVPATETGTPRGVVHDEFAASLRRPAGNAGLFGTAEEVHALGRGLLERTLLSEGSWRRMSSGEGLRVGDPSWMPTPDHLGHTGFTGTSLLLDPVRGTCRVLLTNRVHPDRSRVDLTGFRKSVAQCPSPPTRSGHGRRDP
ncbi:beta-lactamase family protein [Kineococcus sp. NBC_00420]|uniref:serine hydrolase domain-containing protein n=1 Tax=Kineococcus sp. NBC_00420 TaxID=2903564 RepID=UPI002E1F2016